MAGREGEKEIMVGKISTFLFRIGRPISGSEGSGQKDKK